MVKVLEIALTNCLNRRSGPQGPGRIWPNGADEVLLLSPDRASCATGLPLRAYTYGPLDSDVLSDLS